MKKSRGMKKSGGMRTSAGMKRSQGMTRSAGMKPFTGMPKSTGMALYNSSMELFEVYQRPFPQDQLVEGILVSIGSALLAVGGVALVILSSGAAAPLVGMGLIGIGVPGSTTAIISTAQDQFAMLDWLQDFSINAGTTIVTLGAGFGAGALAGIALTSATQLSTSTITALATATGSLAGAGVRSGSYVIVVTANGEPIEAVDIAIEGVTGLLEGAGAAILATKVVLKPTSPRYSMVAQEGDDLDELTIDFILGQGRPGQEPVKSIHVFDRSGSHVRDIDLYHQRTGVNNAARHGEIVGPHSHNYRAVYNPRANRFQYQRGHTTTAFTEDDLIEILRLPHYNIVNGRQVPTVEDLRRFFPRD